MAIASNFPAIRPSLNLDFANAKTLDPRITFSRASAATYYDGKMVAKAEENLLVRSQEFDAASWNKTRISVTANATTAPDGTVTADLISQISGQTDSGVVDQLPTMPNDVVTFSIYAKAEAKTFIVLRVAGLNTWFNLSSGVVATVGLGITAAIDPVGNGWYRCVVSKNAFGFNQAAVRPADSDNSVTVTDSGGIYIWGAQLEQRSQVTAYTPTATQPITNYVLQLMTAAANVPRFDHNPVTGESLGLLVEEQRTNLLFRSEEFSNSIWTKFNTAVEQNVAIAPDGTLTADKLFESSTALVVHGLDQAITTSANTYSASIYAKAAGRTKFRLSSNSGQSPAAEFDLASNTATPIGSTSSATITPVGNGWFRCTATRTVAGGAEAFQIQLMSAASTAYIGDGYSGIYIWGAQLEAGAIPTSYIKTEASQVTRAADSAAMTGTNFSSWYRQNEGTLLGVCVRQAGSYPCRIAYLSKDTNTSEFIGIAASNVNGTSGQISRQSVAQFSAGSISADSGQYSVALAYKTDDSAFSMNGGSLTTDNSVLLPSDQPNRLGIGTVGAYQGHGHLKRIAYYPKRLTDAQLQALTA